MASSAQIVESGGSKLLLAADACGSLRELGALAAQHGAAAVLHTGLFGFFDSDSALRMSEAHLTRVALRARTVGDRQLHGLAGEQLRESVGSQLSELALFLSGVAHFDVPVYTVWGADDDPAVVEKFRSGEYAVPNLFLVDERSAPLIAGTSVRVYGLGGGFARAHLLRAAGHSFASDGARAYVGLWQIGALVHLLARTYDESEFKIFMAAPSVDVVDSFDGVQPDLVDLLTLVFPMDVVLAAGARFAHIGDAYAGIDTPEDVEGLLAAFREYFGAWWDTALERLPEGPPRMRALLESAGSLLASPPDDLVLARVPDTCLRVRAALVPQSSAVFSVSGETASVELHTPVIFDAVKKKRFSRENKEKTRLEKERRERELREKRDKDEKRRDKKERRDSKDGKRDKESPEARAKEPRDALAKDARVGGKAKDPESRKPKEKVDMGLRQDQPERLKKEDAEERRKRKREQRAQRSQSPSKSPSETPPAAAETDAAVEAAAPVVAASASTAEESAVPAAETAPAPRTALWFKNGERAPEEILGFLATDDRDLHPDVAFSQKRKPDGSEYRVAVVKFATEEQAQHAYTRVDKDSAGTVTLMPADADKTASS